MYKITNFSKDSLFWPTLVSKPSLNPKKAKAKLRYLPPRKPKENIKTLIPKTGLQDSLVKPARKKRALKSFYKLDEFVQQLKPQPHIPPPAISLNRICLEVKKTNINDRLETVYMYPWRKLPTILTVSLLICICSLGFTLPFLTKMLLLYLGGSVLFSLSIILVIFPLCWLMTELIGITWKIKDFFNKPSASAPINLDSPQLLEPPFITSEERRSYNLLHEFLESLKLKQTPFYEEIAYIHRLSQLRLSFNVPIQLKGETTAKTGFTRVQEFCLLKPNSAHCLKDYLVFLALLNNPDTKTNLEFIDLLLKDQRGTYLKTLLTKIYIQLHKGYPYNGQTLLHVAIQNKNLPMVQKLISIGANVKRPATPSSKIPDKTALDLLNEMPLDTKEALSLRLLCCPHLKDTHLKYTLNPYTPLNELQLD